MTVDLNTTQVFFPLHHHFAFSSSQQKALSWAWWNFPVLSSPLSEVPGEATEQPGQCCRTAGAGARLAELPPWGNAFAENKHQQCCTCCCGCCIPYSRQLLLLPQWLVSLRKGCTLTAESLNQFPQQDTSLQPHDYFPAVRDFPHLQGGLSKLPALLARLTVWQEHGKTFHLDQPSFLREVAAPLSGLHKNCCSRMEL